MLTKPEIHQTLLLIFFGFLGGLTKELDDLISSKVSFKNFSIGIVTAITTGLIFGKMLFGMNVPDDLVYGLSGLSGFIGPHILYILAKALEKKIESIVPNKKKGD